MKIWIFILFTTFYAGFFAHAETLNEFRREFYQAVEDEDAADKFYEKMQASGEDSSPVVHGYRGMASLLLAANAFNPARKLSRFNEGRQILEKAIQESPQNVELRFLRFGVQKKAPFFLDYSQCLGEDEAILKGFIEDPANQVKDADLWLRIREFLRLHEL